MPVLTLHSEWSEQRENESFKTVQHKRPFELTTEVYQGAIITSSLEREHLC